MSEHVNYTRCDSCGAVAWPDWPMTHRRNCPDATARNEDRR
jgi:hypothetical protein